MHIEHIKPIHYETWMHLAADHIAEISEGANVPELDMTLPRVRSSRYPSTQDALLGCRQQS